MKRSWNQCLPARGGQESWSLELGGAPEFLKVECVILLLGFSLFRAPSGSKGRDGLEAAGSD